LSSDAESDYGDSDGDGSDESGSDFGGGDDDSEEGDDWDELERKAAKGDFKLVIAISIMLTFSSQPT